MVCVISVLMVFSSLRVCVSLSCNHVRFRMEFVVVIDLFQLRCTWVCVMCSALKLRTEACFMFVFVHEILRSLSVNYLIEFECVASL